MPAGSPAAAAFPVCARLDTLAWIDQPAARTAGAARAHRAAQSPIGSTPAATSASWPSTEYAGRGAGRTYASLVVVRTVSGSRPADVTIAWAKSCHDARPDDVPW